MSISVRNSEGYMDLTAHHALTSIRREEKCREKFKKLVFVSSPFAGDVERNIENARRYSRIVMDSGAIPIAPHLLFPQFLDDNDAAERSLGISFGLRLLAKCDAVWVFGSVISQGMRHEINAAKKQRIKIRYFDSQGREARVCRNAKYY